MKQPFNVLYRTGSILSCSYSSTFDNKTANIYVKQTYHIKRQKLKI